MVHTGEHDLIAGPESLAEAAREMEREACHVLPEHDLARRGGIVEIGHRLVSIINDATDCHRGREIAAEIGVLYGEGFERALDHPLRHLRSRRIVEIDTPLSLIRGRQRRKLSANIFDWK